MNLYLRYFDNETVVVSFPDALAFLKSIPEINVNKTLEDDLYAYYNSDMPYPKRYKTRQRAYFIVIKTNATTLEEFKANAHKPTPHPSDRRAEEEKAFDERRVGWYEANINFRRVHTDPRTGRSGYRDTPFAVRLKAISQRDCYDHIIDYLTHRDDIDPRSQYPSIRSARFTVQYLGMSLPTV